jgi:rhomboid family GlyGly-CTERM serine protease
VSRPFAAWLAVAGLFAACALAGWFVPQKAIDWQPAIALSEPWRTLTPIGVHYSRTHLIGNLAGVALAGLFGVAAMAPRRLAWAWLAAWPLTHLGLLLRPELRHYGGLSGVVHAGVAAIAVWVLASARTRAQRTVGVLLALGLVGKIVSEAPWGETLRHPAGWDIAVAPFVHLTGVLAGSLCAIVAVFAFEPRAEHQTR